MPRRQTLLRMFVVLSLFASFGAMAAEWPADPNANPCGAGSARGQAECAKRKLERNTNDMLAVFDKLMASLPPDHDEYQARSRLAQSQADWMRYRDATCAFEGGLSGGATIWQSARAVHCDASATEERAAKLRAYLACAKDEVDACEGFL